MGNNYFVVHMKSDSNPGRVITFDKRCNSYKFDPNTGLFEFYYRPGEDSRLLLGAIPSQNVSWVENIIFHNGEQEKTKTRLDKFAEIFPNLALDSDGLPQVCPKILNLELDCFDNLCIRCKEKYWLGQGDCDQGKGCMAHIQNKIVMGFNKMTFGMMIYRT